MTQTNDCQVGSAYEEEMMGDKSAKTEYDIIINPKARSGMGEMVWKRLEPELKKRRVSYRSYMTRKRNHAENIAAEITAYDRSQTQIVLGGDGTVNEVVNGIKNPEKITFGYIPIGSSNDFARGLGIPKDPDRALDIILNPKKVIHMDLGILTRAGKERRFAVSAGIGFDAAVCHEVCVSRWKIILNRIGLGKLSYAVVALDRLRKDRPMTVKMRFPDGKEKIFDKTYFAAFMNLPYEGGGFKFCPEASAKDGLLDVAVLHGVPVLKILFLLPLAFAGKHVGFKGVNILKCKQVQIKSSKACPLHTDGEPGFLRKEITVRAREAWMRVITG